MEKDLALFQTGKILSEFTGGDLRVPDLLAGTAGGRIHIWICCKCEMILKETKLMPLEHGFAEWNYICPRCHRIFS